MFQTAEGQGQATPQFSPNQNFLAPLLASQCSPHSLKVYTCVECWNDVPVNFRSRPELNSNPNFDANQPTHHKSHKTRGTKHEARVSLPLLFLPFHLRRLSKVYHYNRKHSACTQDCPTAHRMPQVQQGLVQLNTCAWLQQLGHNSPLMPAAHCSTILNFVTHCTTKGS